MRTFVCEYLVLFAGAWTAHLRVHNGVEDLLHEFPFIVAVYESTTSTLSFCTGSLISKSWVITAGHCTFPMSAGTHVVRYADFTLRPAETKAYVKTIKMYLHPNYKEEELKIKNDIGLIFTERVPTNSFAKLSAVDYNALLGLPAKYAGFGDTNKNTNHLSILLPKSVIKPLQVGEGVVIRCPGISAWAPAVCVAPKCSAKHQQPLEGDSGGPLLCDGKLVALLSGSRQIWEPINEYTPVSPNLQWIRDTMLTGNRGVSWVKK